MADPVKYKTWRYDMSNFEKICDWYRVDLHAGMSSREIFNRLIEKKWQEQYTDDIRYMVDMAHNRGSYYGTTLLRTAFQSICIDYSLEIGEQDYGWT